MKGTGNGTVTTGTGDTITSGSAGINVYNQASTIAQAAGSTITVNAYGTITSGATNVGTNQSAGILAGYQGGTTGTPNSTAFGDVKVNNFANIDATAGGDGIRAYNFGPGNIFVTDAGGTTITSKSSGILAVNESNGILAAANSAVTVTVHGTISSGLQNNQNGSLPAALDAGYLPTGLQQTNGSVAADVAMTVTKNAVITAQAGYGVNAFN